MSNIGYATLSVIPSLKGGAAALTSQVSGPARAAGVQSGGIFGGAMGGAMGAGLLAGGAVLAVGGVLAGIGGQFDEAFDNIRVKTGETGEGLESLKGSFREVFASVPTDMATASDAVAMLNQRLGLTGEPLERLSTQMIQLSDLTETDLKTNVADVSRVFGDWSITTGEQSETMDELFRASQASGAGVGDLAQQVVQFGSPLRNLGFSLQESIALFAGFEKGGVNTGTAMAGIRQAVGNFAQDGIAPMEGLAAVMDQVKAGTFTMTDAIDVFGKRAAPDMFAALQEGKFDLTDLLAEIKNGKDTIGGAAEDTYDWQQSLEMLRNRGLLLVEPIANRVFGALSAGARVLVNLTEKIQSGGLTGALQFLRNKFDGLSTPLKIVTVAIGALAVSGTVAGAVSLLGAAVGFLLSPIIAIPLALAAVGAALIYAYNHFEGFRDVVDGVAQWLVGTAWPAIQSFARGVMDAFGQAVAWVQARWPAIQEAIGHVLAVVRAVIGAFVDWATMVWHAWGDDIVHFLQAAWSYVVSTIRNAINVVRGIIDTVLAVINGDWGKAWDGIKQILSAVWDQMKAGLRVAWAAIKGLIGAGLSSLKVLWRGAWSAIKAILSAAWAGIKAAVSAGISAVVGFLRGLPGKAVSALGRMASMLGNVGRGAIRGLWDGLKAVWSSVTGWFRELPGRIVDTIGNVARLLYDAGKAIINGLKDGLVDAFHSVTDFVGGIAGTIADLKGPLPYDRKLLIPHGKAVMAGFHEGLKTGFADVESFVGGIAPTVGGQSGFAFAASPSVANLSSEHSAVRVEIDITGADDDLLRRIRKNVRVQGGDVQVVLGSGAR